ncbi:IDEAL domain-containing protein [Bacillus sp. 03113]|uniref:IDEAL domain-containing protein n=1 Tax=Bacillus sp. 03113 TaxID=2578211 RepID=UPI00215BBEC4|nr:IDEAL domain-containing protein [Bacillus sp. 03113]
MNNQKIFDILKKRKVLIMLEKYLLNSPQKQEENIIDSLFAEIVLDEALKNFRITQVLKQIDQSLQSKNKEEFLSLTEELNQLSKS